MIISDVKLLFMIISHVKIIAFQLSLFCKNYRFSKDCPLYNKQKNTWVVGNTRFISRVEHDISQPRTQGSLCVAAG
jgi:N-acetylneuraminic acid mutarotase